MRVTSKGQVTIPVDLRRLAGIQPNSEVEFGIESGRITIVAKGAGPEAQDDERLEQFLRVLDALEGTGDRAMDAEAVMKLTRDR